MNDPLSRIIATELQARPEQVDSAIRLLDEGNTVPFIARYRKEVTGGLDDTQLRQLETRLGYLRELEDRRQTILKSIDEQGKLTEQLAGAINATLSKTELEDLYLPYKPKRRTRGQIAIEAGLEPLADTLWQDPQQQPEQLAERYVDADKGVADVKAALDGARYILMERFAEDAALLAKVRDYLWKNAHLVSKVVEGKEDEGAKFRDYFDHHEPISQVPSHRALAMFRGRNEGVLQLALNADPQFEEAPRESQAELIIINHLNLRLNNAPADAWRKAVVNWTWRIKVLLHLETELMGTVRERAEDEAINVFARNMHDLLMAAPAGMRATMGLDPGRSANVGEKGDVAVFFGLSGTGKTTLSTDPKRQLIGDDEHGWDDDGVFNFEGGCYAKTIKLSEEAEPDIYHAIKRDALLENVTVLADGSIDFNDGSKTENTRVSYPIYHIQNIVKPVSKAGHATKVIFLTADAFGVLPPVSRLTANQTQYHFLSGFTAKLAGTERGVTEPTPTFSACFGAAFLSLHPTQYAEVLVKRMQAAGAQAYLVNTGWNGTGKRISIKDTRGIIDAILSGEIDKAETVTLPIFDLAMPTALPGVNPEILDPRNTYASLEQWQEKAQDLAERFITNFDKYTDTPAGAALVSAGPKL